MKIATSFVTESPLIHDFPFIHLLPAAFKPFIYMVQRTCLDIVTCQLTYHAFLLSLIGFFIFRRKLFVDEYLPKVIFKWESCGCRIYSPLINLPYLFDWWLVISVIISSNGVINMLRQYWRCALFGQFEVFMHLK